ncbi:acetyl-CoA carboxylase biotin carboxyl carrier protein [Sphingobium sp. CR28]|uniref:acetyl-CoA carboxylase biotin carboxyl carrier protein n=1 Tax=Sphingobium sp. CR28 TaxID=3400272 RepID=UPI003FEF8260
MADKIESNGGPMQIDVKLVRDLAKMLDQTNLTEIEVADGERRIRVAREPAPQAASFVATAPMAAPALASIPAPAATPAPVAAAVAPQADANAVKSPMVGTVYLASEPSAPPFVSVGDTVKAGQTLLIVEAMKVMNPITAPAAGTVKAVFVENGQPVEYDQPLIVVA